MKSFYPLAIVIVLGIFFTACSDDTVVGNGLFENEELGVEHIDNLPLPARTIMGEPILSYSSGSTSKQTYLLGKLDDPYFGISRAAVYLNCGISGSLDEPDFTGVTVDDLDSIVLALKLDTLGFYGDEEATFNIKVYRMEENIREIDSIFSDKDFMAEMLVGEINDFKPAASATDTLKIIEENGESVYPGIGQIRVPLEIGIAQEIINNQDKIQNDTSFMELINGFYVVVEPSSSSMIAVDLSPVAYQSKLSELAVYYSDTMKYGFSAGLIKSSRFSNDYTGSTIEEAINGDFTFGDSLLFIESMAGTDVEIEFPETLTEYNDRLLNFAELELNVATIIDYDVEDYPYVSLLISSSENEDGDLRVLEDFALSSSTFRPELLEVMENGETILRYRIPVTRFVKNIIEGTNFDNTLTLNSFVKGERPNRTILYGTQHSTYPSKLRLTFTK